MNDKNQRCFQFSRSLRVRNQADFDRVYQTNVYAADKTLVVQGCFNQQSVSRLGLAVSRRVGNAVVRNRWKRVIRDVFRRQRAELPAGLDLVVRPRRGASLSCAAVEKALPQLVRRIDRQLRRSTP